MGQRAPSAGQIAIAVAFAFSVAFSVAFQSAERTLSDDDAARLRAAIVSELSSRFGAELRA